MLLFNQDVFDEVIIGTGTTWYTSASFNAQLGSADKLLLLAYTTGITSGTPTLTVSLDSSADGQHWYTSASSLINGTVGEGTVVKANAVVQDLLAFVRFKITLGPGSTTQCRLKLTATGRAV